MSKSLISLLCICLSLANSYLLANEYDECYNIVSESYNNRISDIEIVREINGGTIVIPIFDNTCPEDLKNAFSYACKIFEEYLPSCPPLYVKVSCGRVNQSGGRALSKVSRLYTEEFDHPPINCSFPISAVKGILLGELFGGSTAYASYIPNLECLTLEPDMSITYNTQMLQECSFSLDANPGDKYDFVSVALRDLLIGLGISSSFRSNPITNELYDPTGKMTPFESFIDKTIGHKGKNNERYIVATKGSLFLPLTDGSYVRGLTLYAPTTWINGTSLNYFIPSPYYSISHILAYDFGKGTVARYLGNSFHREIFSELLGWIYNVPTSTGSSSATETGSTSNKIAYKRPNSAPDTQLHMRRSNSTEDLNNIVDYLYTYHPYQHPQGNYNERGASISVLKKDGTWNLVQYSTNYWWTDDVEMDMSTWTLHYPNEEYARTLDGHLRVRRTTANTNGHGMSYSSRYFVADYLPQQVKLNYIIGNLSTQNSIQNVSDSSNHVRLYFRDTEGANRIVLERKREGARLPTRTDVENFRCGYYDVVLDKTTTFTVVAFNDNGNTRSLPLTIEAVSTASKVRTLSYTLENGIMKFATDDDQTLHLDYVISPIGIEGSQATVSGYTDSSIDLGSLPHGTYVIKVTDRDSGVSKTYKIRK